LACALFTGCLFAGPCGITTLQLQDFLTTTLIRTGVSTVAAAMEAAIVEAAQEPDGDQP
jgi:hypothetical protein